MKVLIPILIGLLVVGCGKKTSKPEAKANPPSTSPAQEVNNNQPKTDPKPKQGTKNPEHPKDEPKVEVKKPLTKEESAKVIEVAIRKAAKKPTDELTKADLEKVTMLNLAYNKLTGVKGLEKLTQLEVLDLAHDTNQEKRISTLYARLLKLQKEMADKVDLKAAFPEL